MISLISNAIPIATFIYYPLKDLLVYAFKGFGAYSIDTKTNKVTNLKIQKTNISNVLGSGGTKGIEEPLRQLVLNNLRKHTNRLFIGSAGIETIMLASNEIQFVFHGRVTPWDHSPLDLITKEAGGCVYMANDKTEFNAFSEGPIIAASNYKIWKSIRDLAFKKN
jgi:fructose-1,6-bisphosphatase/inositol monophosphatase family enzyme